MARKLRLEYAGACYHVINRGNYRHDVFGTAGAAEAFEVCLGEAAERYGWQVHAYVVMRNHFHLAIETPEPNLSAGMQWLQVTWAMRFNRFRGEHGRPFQGRYQALVVEPGEALAQVAHYIHLNPVRAGLLPPEQAAQYRWSSLRRFLAPDRPVWLTAATILRESGELPDTADGWRGYLAYLAVLATEDPARREERFGAFNRGWAIGSEEFKTEAGARLAAASVGRRGERFRLLGADTTAQRAAQTIVWEGKLRQAAQGLGVDLAHLPSRKSAPEKVRLAALMKAATSVTNGWLAHRLQMGEPASVSQYIRRHRLAGVDRAPAYQSALSIIKT